MLGSWSAESCLPRFRTCCVPLSLIISHLLHGSLSNLFWEYSHWKRISCDKKSNTGTKVLVKLAGTKCWLISHGWWHQTNSGKLGIAVRSVSHCASDQVYCSHKKMLNHKSTLTSSTCVSKMEWEYVWIPPNPSPLLQPWAEQRVSRNRTLLFTVAWVLGIGSYYLFKNT